MTQADDILVTLSTFGEYSDEPVQILRKSRYTYLLNGSGKRMDPLQVADMGSESVGVIAGVEEYNAGTLSALSKLRCISRVGAGIDNIDLAYARERGIAVLNTPDAPTAAVAELTVGMMLALLRRLTEVDDLMHQRKWQRIPGRLLSGKTVGIVGLGRIGRRVAELVSTFEVKVVAADPHPDQAWLKERNIDLLPLTDLLSLSHIVTLHAAGSMETPLFFDQNAFSAIRPGGWFINMARGDMVDDSALYGALESGHLSGAGLDVYPDEPYTGILCDHPRVVLSPHQATLAKETRIMMETDAVLNLLQHLEKSQ